MKKIFFIKKSNYKNSFNLITKTYYRLIKVKYFWEIQSLKMKVPP